MKNTNFTAEQNMKINQVATDMASNAVYFINENPDCSWSAAAWSENKLRSAALSTAQEVLAIMGYDAFISKPNLNGGCYRVLTVSIKE